jgi:hypothetical protein
MDTLILPCLCLLPITPFRLAIYLDNLENGKGPAAEILVQVIGTAYNGTSGDAVDPVVFGLAMERRHASIYRWWAANRNLRKGKARLLIRNGYAAK